MPGKNPMPPPGGGRKPGGLMIAVGVPKPSAKPAEPDSPDEPEDKGDSGKMSAEEALVVREDKHCRNCQHYMGESGECQKVEGIFSPDDACLRWFTPAEGDSEPDADEYGGAPDADADEMTANAGAMG